MPATVGAGQLGESLTLPAFSFATGAESFAALVDALLMTNTPSTEAIGDDGSKEAADVNEDQERNSGVDERSFIASAVVPIFSSIQAAIPEAQSAAFGTVSDPVGAEADPQVTRSNGDESWTVAISREKGNRAVDVVLKLPPLVTTEQDGPPEAEKLIQLPESELRKNHQCGDVRIAARELVPSPEKRCLHHLADANKEDLKDSLATKASTSIAASESPTPSSPEEAICLDGISELPASAETPQNLAPADKPTEVEVPGHGVQIHDLNAPLVPVESQPQKQVGVEQVRPFRPKLVAEAENPPVEDKKITKLSGAAAVSLSSDASMFESRDLNPGARTNKPNSKLAVGDHVAVDPKSVAISGNAFHVERLAQRLAGPEMRFDWRMSDAEGMQVSTVVHDRTLELTISTERSETVSALRTELPSLDSQLRENSFKLGEVKITSDDSLKSQMQMNSQQRGTQEWRTAALIPLESTTEITAVPEEAEVWRGGSTSGRVSLLA